LTVASLPREKVAKPPNGKKYKKNCSILVAYTDMMFIPILIKIRQSVQILLG